MRLRQLLLGLLTLLTLSWLRRRHRQGLAERQTLAERQLATLAAVRQALAEDDLTAVARLLLQAYPSRT